MRDTVQNNHRALTDSEIAQLEAQGNRCENWGGVLVAADGFDAALAHGCALSGDIRIGKHVSLNNACVLSCGDGTDLRIKAINENGGRAILPCPGMTCADAFIMAKYRGDKELMAKLSAMSSRYYGNDRSNCDGGPPSSCPPVTVIGDNTVIGYGVQIRNSIIGPGSRIDTAAQLENVMTGENARVGRAARITHSYIGDCSHIECCEVANCFTAPFHSQHHNNSFLIAAMVGGQSNVAAGAVIGSNHNGRSNDGEIWAKRGFWPGLCVSLKHNSRFASFTMIAKGDYPAELDVKLPFSLISRDEKTASTIIRPAFWFTRNMYAVMRCQQKFISRDDRDRSRRYQSIEHDILAPDTVEEIFEAIRILKSGEPLNMERGRPETAVKLASEAVSAYELMIRHYCAQNILPYMRDGGINGFDGLIDALGPIPDNNEKWLNCGGMVIAETALSDIVTTIKTGSISTWPEANALFDKWTSAYGSAKVKHALKSLARLHAIPPNALSDNELSSFIKAAPADAETIAALTRSSRQKDYADPFRTMVYDSPEELEAVLGRFEDDPVIAATV